MGDIAAQLAGCLLGRDLTAVQTRADPFEPGDTVCIETGGGGGYGAPSQRPAEQVERDVDAGYVSAAAAPRDYSYVARR
jgi:N-methylhydantoinase B/oxoprolinase/acetone carboxylase alpha subunit